MAGNAKVVTFCWSAFFVRGCLLVDLAAVTILPVAPVSDEFSIS
jgi:hypothetical protein